MRAGSLFGVFNLCLFMWGLNLGWFPVNALSIGTLAMFILIALISSSLDTVRTKHAMDFMEGVQKQLEKRDG